MTVTIYVNHRTEGKSAAASLYYGGIPDDKWRREKLWKKKKKKKSKNENRRGRQDTSTDRQFS